MYYEKLVRFFSSTKIEMSRMLAWMTTSASLF